MQQHPTGDVTFLFSDIEGSTTLWEQHPVAMQAALERHDALMKQVVDAHNGYLVKTTGDGVVVAFAEAIDGVRAAIEMQRVMGTESWNGFGGLKIRIGLHSGPAQLRDGDYYGTTLNRAARLMGLGHGGQILLSTTTQGFVQDFLPDETTLLDLGEYNLRNLSRPERVYQLYASGLCHEFPALSTTKPGIRNLPKPQTSFVGRDEELQQIQSHFDNSDCRLITLVGPGGIGKSRLSIEAARLAEDAFADDVLFVPLTAVTTLETLVSSLNNALQFAPDAAHLGPAEDQLLQYLSTRNSLLVLDNFEQLIEHADFIGQILEESSRLKIIVTSRERLNLQSEWALEIEGLHHESNGHNPTNSSAVKLFVERARQAQSGFELNDGVAPDLNRICEMLQGMPLGVELAAAWTSTLTCKEIADEIEKNLDFLSASKRDLPEKHRSIKAVFTHSWNLLPPEEQAGFRKLSVFINGFTRESAESVAGLRLDQLSSLVDKSLLFRNQSGRYNIHLLLKQYAAEELAQLPDEQTEVQQLHSGYYLNYLAGQKENILGVESRQALRAIEADDENFKAALAWAFLNDDIETGLKGLDSFCSYYIVRGWEEGSKTFGELAALLEAERMDQSHRPLWLGAQVHDALFKSERGFHEAAEELCQQCLVELKALNFTHELGICYHSMGINAEYRGEYEASIELFKKKLELVDELHWTYASAQLWWGWAHYELGQYQEAKKLFEQAYRLSKKYNNQVMLGYAVSKLGTVMDALDDYEQAMKYHKEARKIFISNAELSGEATTVSRMSLSEYGLGHYDNAKAFGLEAYDLFEAAGHRWGMLISLCRTGFATLGLNDSISAKQCFMQALEKAVEINIPALGLYALGGMGAVLVKENDLDAAAELLAVAIHNPATPAIYRDIVVPFWSEVEQKVPADQLNTIIETAKSTSLEDIAAKVMEDHLVISF